MKHIHFQAGDALALYPLEQWQLFMIEQLSLSEAIGRGAVTLERTNSALVLTVRDERLINQWDDRFWQRWFQGYGRELERQYSTSEKDAYAVRLGQSPVNVMPFAV